MRELVEVTITYAYDPEEIINEYSLTKNSTEHEIWNACKDECNECRYPIQVFSDMVEKIKELLR